MSKNQFVQLCLCRMVLPLGLRVEQMAKNVEMVETTANNLWDNAIRLQSKDALTEFFWTALAVTPLTYMGVGMQEHHYAGMVTNAINEARERACRAKVLEPKEIITSHGN